MVKAFFSFSFLCAIALLLLTAIPALTNSHYDGQLDLSGLISESYQNALVILYLPSS